MRVLVCGGRDYIDLNAFRAEMHKIAQKHFPRTEPDEYGNYLYTVTIIAGGASGADRMTADWAANEWCQYEEYKADWSSGTKAGPIRNERMLIEGKPDLVVAFPGGRGTADMVRRACKAGVKVIEVNAAPVGAA